MQSTSKPSPAVHALTAPSEWVARWLALVPAGARVLDVACGAGRHALLAAQRGFKVSAVDIEVTAVESLLGDYPGVSIRKSDIESYEWPYINEYFDAIIVTNYLHRALMPHLLAGLAPGGVLIYETFAVGNERYGKPSNANFLLRRGELLELALGRLQVIAYEDVYVDLPKPAMVQRICARNADDSHAAA